MSNGSSGLSDALRQMSEGEHESTRSSEKDAGEPIAQANERQPAFDVDHVEEEVPSQASSARRTATSTKSNGARARQVGHADIKALSVPVLAGTGVLLLIVGMWAVLILTGASVPMHNRPGASIMATWMLLMLPLAIAMFAGSGYFYWELQQAKGDTGKGNGKSKSTGKSSRGGSKNRSARSR